MMQTLVCMHDFSCTKAILLVCIVVVLGSKVILSRAVWVQYSVLGYVRMFPRATRVTSITLLSLKISSVTICHFPVYFVILCIYFQDPSLFVSFVE